MKKIKKAEIFLDILVWLGIFGFVYVIGYGCYLSGQKSILSIQSGASGKKLTCDFIPPFKVVKQTTFDSEGGSMTWSEVKDGGLNSLSCPNEEDAIWLAAKLNSK